MGTDDSFRSRLDAMIDLRHHSQYSRRECHGADAAVYTPRCAGWFAQHIDPFGPTVQLLRDIKRMPSNTTESHLSTLEFWRECVWRIYRQHPKEKGKFYALYTLEVENIGKSKDRQSRDFGVKASPVIAEQQGGIVGASTFAAPPHNSRWCPKSS
ncbi:hypothetical protein [Burkholderia ubonensis]|uniref:hypothetical protein n=1 Tax=Burkholderia ubonensis TaxID=101571 RepID=UPI0012F7F9BA|nr:hypothetical protein [Burkholderia ubonensis]